jgi:hypothetical protein
MILGIAALLFSIPALAAEWKQLGGGDGFTTSADLSSAQRTGDVVDLWTLWNYDKPEVVAKTEFLSMKEHVLYNCADHTTAIIGYILYSGRDAGGKIKLERTKPAMFVSGLEGSASDGVRKFACAIPPKS